MSSMVKPLLLGTLLSVTIAAVVGLTLLAVDASGNVSGIAFILTVCVGGLIGAEIAHRLPPPPSRKH